MHGRVVDRIKKFVQRKFWFVSRVRKTQRENSSQERKQSISSRHRGSFEIYTERADFANLQRFFNRRSQ